MDEVKPVYTEKYDIEYRDKTITVTSFSLGYRDFDEEIKLKEFFINNSIPVIVFLIFTLLNKSMR